MYRLSNPKTPKHIRGVRKAWVVGLKVPTLLYTPLLQSIDSGSFYRIPVKKQHHTGVQHKDHHRYITTLLLENDTSKSVNVQDISGIDAKSIDDQSTQEGPSVA
jgi:hypothetical protein